jgi:hypothetical protein
VALDEPQHETARPALRPAVSEPEIAPPQPEPEPEPPPQAEAEEEPGPAAAAEET